jgi:hypothetical protein
MGYLRDPLDRLQRGGETFMGRCHNWEKARLNIAILSDAVRCSNKAQSDINGSDAAGKDRVTGNGFLNR